jgi:protein-S-isoprenylcysteine O-methyltransferase Ste14
MSVLKNKACLAHAVIPPSRAATSEQLDTPAVIAPPPLIYLVALAIGFVLEALLPSASVPAAASWSVGSVFVIAGVALARSFFRALHHAHTPISPYSSAKALVTTGPYALSRNPGYLGMTLAYVGIAILSGALWVLVPLVPTLFLIDRGVIRREERHLERSFGADYARYRARTRRWI